MESLFAEIEQVENFEKEQKELNEHLQFLKKYFDYIPEVGSTGEFHNTIESTIEGESFYVYCLTYMIIEKLDNHEWIVQCDVSYNEALKDHTCNGKKFLIKSTGLWPDIYNKLKKEV
jgi:hypothetical protein